VEKLVIYDGNGVILSVKGHEAKEPTNVPFLWAEIPKKKRLVGVDVSTSSHEPIFEDAPLSENEQRIERSELDINTLGERVVQEELKALQAQTDRDSLGEQVVGLDLRLLQGGL